ncbi:MAG: JAB domain-containing protein [Sphingobium sp.]|uniref:JAB domain-containing protein n=1 Tax=Sphingobium sp. TaxID=1912891 RepID=UPI0029B30398|nr:JAB domain-containing protein [Sphingobium sp.]MDX3909030.1 JAB domain-containing protein [Sphingobium sp.]
MWDAGAAYVDDTLPGSTEAASVLLLDKEGQIIRRMAFDGLLDQVTLPLRQIVREALKLDCHGLILIHNHPSGDVRPSGADIQVTRRLCQVFRALGIRLLDHIIVAPHERFSFRDQGML